MPVLEVLESEQEELFEEGVLDGDGRSLKTLIDSGLAVEMTTSLMSAEVPLRGGLLDPGKFGKAAVTFEVAKVEVVAVRKEGRLEGWKVRQVLRPTYVEAAEE